MNNVNWKEHVQRCRDIFVLRHSQRCFSNICDITFWRRSLPMIGLPCYRRFEGLNCHWMNTWIFCSCMPPLFWVEFPPQVRRCATGIVLDLWSEDRWFEPRCLPAISGCTSDGKEVQGVLRTSGSVLGLARCAKEPWLPISWVPGSRSKFLRLFPVHYLAMWRKTATNQSLSLESLDPKAFWSCLGWGIIHP